MILVAKWRYSGRVNSESSRFRTPVGGGFARLEDNGTEGTLVVGIRVDASDSYIEPRHHSALGLLAFYEIPTIGGKGSSLRCTAVPKTWLDNSNAITSLLARAGLRAKIDGRSIQVEHASASPSSLVRRTALAFYALDSFARSKSPQSQFEALRVEATKAFRETGTDIIALLDDVTGSRGLRELLPESRRQHFKPPAPRNVASDHSAPEIKAAGKTIRAEANQWDRTFDAFSRWTIEPQWLMYLPPGMCSLQSEATEGPLEHPKTAFDYYRNEGLDRVVVEFKHMGSRAIAIVCKDDSVAPRRFGVPGLGTVYSRNGRPFFADPTPALEALRASLKRANFWDEFRTDWVCLDGEYLPWTLKAEKLLEGSHGQVLTGGTALLSAMEDIQGFVPEPERSCISLRQECFRQYSELLQQYRSAGEGPARFAPFQLIATEGRSYFDRGHGWHMQSLVNIAKRAGEPFLATKHLHVLLNRPDSIEQCFRWWDTLTSSRAEGMVIKAPACVPRGRRGFAQHALKCRTQEHLRLVYGPDYDLLENRWNLSDRDALKRRREKHRRVVKQLLLSVEGVERFIRRRPLGEVENCVRTIMSLDA